jgi:hypothetical protein
MNYSSGRLASFSPMFDSFQSVDLVAEVCDRLGFTSEDVQLILDGQCFVSPAGLTCRFHVDLDEDQCGLRPELELPLLLEDLETPQIAHLLDLQTVLSTTMGWAVTVGADQGQLCLSTLKASTTAEEVVHDLESGNLLAISVLQMLVTEVTEPQPALCD